MSEIKSIIDRAVRLEEEKRRAAEDLKELYAEAKANGHDVPALKLLVKEALETEAKRAKREAAEEMAEVYRRALGQLADTPLGSAAVAAAADGQSRVKMSFKGKDGHRASVEFSPSCHPALKEKLVEAFGATESTAQEAPAPSAAQAEGATGEIPEQGEDETDGGASLAETRVHSAVQSSQFGTGTTGAGEGENAGASAPPPLSAPGRQYEPTPVRVIAPIDLTIPASLDRRSELQRAGAI